jgi:hypothetical protein
VDAKSFFILTCGITAAEKMKIGRLKIEDEVVMHVLCTQAYGAYPRYTAP